MKTYNWEQMVAKELDKITPLFHAFPWEDKAAYSDFISNMYYFLSQACRLLTAAASKCDLDMDKFYHRFVDHAVEERNHEKLVLGDLRHLKVDLQPCLPSMPAVWQTQFFLIQNKNPLALLGCILYLENLSLHPGTGPYCYERSRAAFGEKCANYLRVHVLEDGDHVVKLFETLKALPQEASPVVLESFLTTSSLYFNFFRELSLKHSTGVASVAS
jgi:hypothetical protein